MIHDIAGVTVSYNMKQLLSDAVNSIRKFYPDFTIVVVDGSPEGSECRTYVEQLAQTDEHTSTLTFDWNIGHGRGMHAGLSALKTKYALLFDTDVVVTKPFLNDMMDKIGSSFGIGAVHENWKKDGLPTGIRYLHPMFAIIDRERYLTLPPFVHNFAPCHKTMRAVNGDVVSFPVREYIIHYPIGQTRRTNPPGYCDNWE
jgi:glycosyltransferase involved in cell wall biosynthesis